jgi:predicted CopG family antitoxin
MYVVGMMLKTIKVDDKVHAELTKLGKWGEPMSDIVTKCIEAYKRVHK